MLGSQKRLHHGELRFGNDSKKKTINNQQETVDNPISAGVDGTQSASGVIGYLDDYDDTKNISKEEQINLLKKRLIPRCTTVSLNQEHATTNHTKSSQQWYSVTLDGRMLWTPVGKCCHFLRKCWPR